MRAGIHWMTGTVLPDAETGVSDPESVLDHLAGFLRESVVVSDRAGNGYTEAWEVGPLRVLAHPERPEMGVSVVMSGEACEELGLRRVAAIRDGLGLRVSRLDLAFDNCPFEPEDLREFWRAGWVRTRAKVPEDAREDRQWRTSDWRESAQGDTFNMGARTSSQCARCYDRRESGTRFELELKGKASALAAEQLCGLVANEAVEAFALVALSWVRRFVDFVDPRSDSNAARQTILPFWELFVEGAEKASVTLEGVVTRTVEDMQHWFVRQVAPVWAVLSEALGADKLQSIAQQGRERYRGKHREALRLHRLAAGVGA
jgi:DNA relaxase NicK